MSETWRNRPISRLKGTVIRTSWFPQTSELTGDPLLLRLRDLIFIISCILRSNTSQHVCARSLRAFGSPVLTYAHLGSRNETYDILQSCFASDLSITQSSMVSQDFSAQGSSHVPPIPLCHRAETRSAWELLPLFRAILQSSMQILCWCRIFNQKFVGFCSGKSRLNLGSQGEAFFFFQKTSLPVIWQFFQHLFIQVGQGLLVLPFSCLRGGKHASILYRLHLLHGQTFGYKVQYAFHLRFESRTVTIIDLHLRLASRIFSSWSTRFFNLLNISSGSVSKFKFFVSLLCIICQSVVIISCGRPRSLSKASMYSHWRRFSFRSSS